MDLVSVGQNASMLTGVVFLIGALAVVLSEHRKTYIGWIWILQAASLGLLLLIRTQVIPSANDDSINTFSTVVLGSFATVMVWVSSSSFVDIDFRVGRWHVLALGLLVGSRALDNSFGEALPHHVLVENGAWFQLFASIASGIVGTSIIGLSIYTLVRQIDDDLVVASRAIRLTLAGGLLVISGYTIIVRWLGGGAPTIATTGSAIAAIAAFCAVTFLFAFLITRVSDLSGHGSVPRRGPVPVGIKKSQPQPLPSTANISASTEPQVVNAAEPEDFTEKYRADTDKIDAYMRKQQVFRKSDLKLTTLAELMEIPRHRLREYINKGLGYRNFNAFINNYRLEMAADMLADPKCDDKVFAIALESGFASLAPFNKAFRDHFQMSPSEYRTKNQSSESGRQESYPRTGQSAS